MDHAPRGPPTLELIWINFIHLFFCVSATVCDLMDCAVPTRVFPCSLYAGLFVCIDIACNVFEYQVLARADATQVDFICERMMVPIASCFESARSAVSTGPLSAPAASRERVSRRFPH